MELIPLLQHTQRIQGVLSQVTFEGFEWVVGGAYSGHLFLQIECRGEDNVTGEPLEWKSRKWMLSPHMTDGEIVQTAFKAVLTAIEHEARERFKYRGQAIFDPHYDIEKLVELRASSGTIKERA